MKLKADGSLERLKARLVSNGFTQLEGIDCVETFSPIVKPQTIHIVLTITLNRGRVIKQLDVKNAFLHAFLKEQMFMNQLPRVCQSYPTYVCKLSYALYGLKQAPRARAWFNRLSHYLIHYGFLCNTYDPSLFVLHNI